MEHNLSDEGFIRRLSVLNLNHRIDLLTLSRWNRVMAENALDVLELWVERVNSGDINGTLSLYADSAVLLPTFSSENRDNLEAIRNYFSGFSEYESIHVSVDRNSLIIQQHSKAIYSLAGFYSWSLRGGAMTGDFLARFTFTINLESDSPILHHHSSLVP